MRFNDEVDFHLPAMRRVEPTPTPAAPTVKPRVVVHKMTDGDYAGAKANPLFAGLLTAVTPQGYKCSVGMLPTQGRVVEGADYVHERKKRFDGAQPRAFDHVKHLQETEDRRLYARSCGNPSVVILDDIVDESPLAKATMKACEDFAAWKREQETALREMQALKGGTHTFRVYGAQPLKLPPGAATDALEAAFAEWVKTRDHRHGLYA